MAESLQILSAAGLVLLIVINITKRSKISWVVGNTHFISSFSSLLNIFHDQ
jgi:hypothetical protein